jgi:glycosyltransferase involved in cell wall biosynthesis
MNKPLFSVVIPAYNAAKTIEAAAQSVFEQTIRDFEIVVVDDGSKDDTLAVAETIAASDSRVRVISQPNGGAAAARNAGIKAAIGKYVAFLDADDLWLAHKLERQLAVLDSEEDVNAVRCGAYYVNNDLEVLSARPCFESDDVLLEILLFQNQSPWMSTLVVERGVFAKIGGFDTKLYMIEDWELAIRLARHCNLKSVEEPLALYRQFPGNRSKDWSSHIESGRIVLERLFKDPTLPIRIKQRRRLIYSAFNTMLSGGAFHGGDYIESLKWGLKAFLKHPAALRYMVSLPLRKLRRNSSRQSVPPEYEASVRKFLNRQNEYNPDL